MTKEHDDLSTLVHGLKTKTSPFRTVLNELHQTYKPMQEGTIANTIPELAKASPDCFGICVVDTSGKVYEVGDSNKPFLIQSLAKPFLYGLTLDTYGREQVLAKIGVEVTQDSFDALLSDKESCRLQNPMLHVGAMVNVSMIKGENQTARLNALLKMFQQYIGHDVQVDTPAFVSSRLTGHRYRALTYLLLDNGIIREDVEETLDLFFQQSVVQVTCRDIATMAATLANKGINPITGERAISDSYIRDVLSIMYTSGMHGFTGEWSYRVGLPSKSSISGGLFAVVPNQGGIGIFSPPLNDTGHSVRGIHVCENLSQHFGLHMFDAKEGGKGLIDAMDERHQQSRSRGDDARGRVSRALDLD